MVRQAGAARRVLEFAAVAVVLVMLSVFATLFATGAIDLSGFKRSDGEGGVAYRNVTLTDVQLECMDYAADELGARIKTINVDDHSSRYDPRSDRFKIFLEAELYDEGASTGRTKHFYINCFSRANRLAITTFELLEDRDLPARAIRESTGGNAFGM